MLELIKDWFNRYFSDPEAVILLFVLLFGLFLVMFMGQVLAPVFAAVVIAYLLDWLVARLVHGKVPRTLAVIIVFLLFMGLVVIALLGLLPLFWNQASTLVHELPSMMTHVQTLVVQLPERFPEFISVTQLDKWIVEFKQNLGTVGQFVLSASLASIPSVLNVIVYFVLVPLLVYFFLMDKQAILE